MDDEDPPLSMDGVHLCFLVREDGTAQVWASAEATEADVTRWLRAAADEVEDHGLPGPAPG